ncbi:AAA family ATPase [Candidatus Methylocalor cossyra]|uniref:APH domain-containing protein n=1 Tax=Candidatus Methylocalor cossyra TaxID=3108543 RepID=A0ABM9NF05_9GAMM
MPESPSPPWLRGLLEPAAYPHATGPIELRETHISWVLLAGDFAYKIKKPVNLGFLDFSTLELRRWFCTEELRLNRRYAGNLYRAVVPITGSPEHPRVSGTGSAFEYAVAMRRFDDAQLFDRLLDAHRLLPEHLERLAETVAAFHASTERATAADHHGLPERQQQAAEINFTTIHPRLDDPFDRTRLDALWAWTRAEFARRAPLLEQRKQQGLVRECHGDLHLGNIVLLDGQPTPFDGIEFNEDFRWIDTMSELAFLAMDLEARGEVALAYRFLNRYLELSGDYPGMALLDYFRLYRAMVRAKIAQLCRDQAGTAEGKAHWLRRYRGYVEFGLRLIKGKRPFLLITHGVSGSGKSHLTARLADCLSAIRLRSDLERKRLAGLAAEAQSGSGLGDGLYSAAMTERTYQYLAATAEALLAAGHSVIIDATHLKHQQRLQQRRVAERCDAAFLILDCQAPRELLRARVRSRAAAGTDPSEADLAVLEQQLAQREVPTEDERPFVVTVDTSQPQAMEGLPERVRKFLESIPGMAAP